MHSGSCSAVFLFLLLSSNGGSSRSLFQLGFLALYGLFSSCLTKQCVGVVSLGASADRCPRATTLFTVIENDKHQKELAVIERLSKERLVR
jgi:hypothetical protein